MTESAKQDTTKAPAQTAGSGPAAKESPAKESPAKESPAKESTATEREARPEAVGEPQENADAEAGEPAKSGLDETKRKFREALERKHHARGEGQGNGGRDGGKINGAHGPAASRRSFRRKSG